MSSRPILRPLASALVAVATLLLVAPAAGAHTDLTGVDPAEGSTLAEGAVVTLTFADDLLDLGAEAVVVDVTGASTALAVSFPVANAVALTIPALPEGAFSLSWRVVASDGHPIEGSLAYVAPAAPIVTPSPTASASPEATAANEGTETNDASASPTAALGTNAANGDDADEGSQGGLPLALWLAVGAAILAAITTTIVAARKR